MCGKMRERESYNTFSLCMPIIFQAFFQILFGIADTWFVSFCSDLAVAAVGYANQLVAVILLCFLIISSAISILGAQYLGAKEEEKAKKISADAVTLTVLISIGIMIIVLAMYECIADVLRVPVEIRKDMASYFKIIVLGLVFQGGNTVLTTIYRIFAKAKYAMCVGIFVNLLNIVADAIIVYAPMGYMYDSVRGIAWATVFSNAVGFVFMIIKSLKYLSLKYTLNMSKENIKLLLRYGFPSAAENISYKVSQFVVTIFLGQLGGIILSAKIYAMNIMLFVSLIPNSLGIATGILVGYLWGEKKELKAYGMCYRNIVSGILIVGVTNLFIFVWKDWSLNIFTNDKEILNVAKSIMSIEAVLMFIKTGNFMFGNSLKGIGDVYYSAILGVISTWILGVGLSYVLGITLGFGVQGIYYGFGADEAFRCIMLWNRWKKVGRRNG